MGNRSQQRAAAAKKRKAARAKEQAKAPKTAPSAPGSLRDAAVTAVGFGTAAASIATFSGWQALLAVTLIVGLLGLLLPHRRVTYGLETLAAVLLIATVVWAVKDDSQGAKGQGSAAGTSSKQRDADWDRDSRGSASVTDSVGYYPARPARRCGAVATCAAGVGATLNSLVFTEGFPQGVGDERRFLLAQQVGPDEHVQPMHDPLRIAPGQNVRIDGIVDNSGHVGNPKAIAEDVRALIALPPGQGRRHVVLTSVSSANAVPAAVSDSVTLVSNVPTYLRYERTTAYITRRNKIVHRLPDTLVTTYDPKSLDRRQLASQGVLIGCHKPDGRLPAGRGCSLHYQAILDVRYAATKDYDNGVGRVEGVGSSVSAHVRGAEEEVYLYWSPKPDDQGYLSVAGGDRVYLDCALRSGGTRWYHVSWDEDYDDYGSNDTSDDINGFLPADALTRISGGLPRCDT